MGFGVEDGDGDSVVPDGASGNGGSDHDAEGRAFDSSGFENVEGDDAVSGIADPAFIGFSGQESRSGGNGLDDDDVVSISISAVVVVDGIAELADEFSTLAELDIRFSSDADGDSAAD